MNWTWEYLLAAAVAGAAIAGAAAADEPLVAAEDAAAAPASVESPLEPQEALDQFVLADPDLQIELAACEPNVVDPVEVRFDEDGRMWVVEMRDYPLGPPPGAEPLSRIRVLGDKDGDGFFETATTFAEGLLFPTGLQPWKGGVFVTLGGRVAWMKDTDGDGRADVDETWYSGFAEENSQLRANHPRFGPDNWIYVGNGLRGGKIKNHRLPDAEPVDIAGRDFRFNPLTGDCEAVSGHGQFGLTFDDYGNRFVCSNRHPLQHVVIEERYLKLNPYAAIESVVQDVAKAEGESRVYPLSRAWTTSNLHAGQFTAACGALIYRGDGLPSEFYGNAFICEPTGNLVHREILAPDGPTFTSQPAYEGREFLATVDEWFRPVNLESGPDGALYVVDMYRAVIEHPDWVPDELKHRPDERWGEDRGRVWRIARMTAGRRRGGATLSVRTAAGVGALLGNENGWHRDTAQRLLYERQDLSASRMITTMLYDRSLPAVQRVAAFNAAVGLNALTEIEISATTEDVDHRVAVPALREIGARGGMRTHRDNGWHAMSFEMPDSRRLHTILAMGDPREDLECDRYVSGWLRSISPGELWLRRAVLVALADDPLRVVEWLAHRSDSGNWPWVETLMELVGARNIPKERSRAVAVLARYAESHGSDNGERRADAALLQFLESLRRRGEDVATILAELADEAPLARSFIDDAFARAAVTSSDHERGILPPEVSIGIGEAESANRRAISIRLLAFSSDEYSRQTLLTILQRDPSQDLRLGAIAALAQHRDPSIGPLLLEDFQAQTPAIRAAILDALLADAERTKLLLDEIAAGNVAVAEIDRTRIDRLLNHSDAAIAARARELLAAALPADRQQVLADYQACLQLEADARAGREVFRKHCVQCHKIADLGIDVAPDISDSRTKTREQLLADILQPNRAIDANYVAYNVLSTDGRSLVGAIAAETATSVTLKLPEGKTETLLRSDIEELRSSGVSLMPDGLEKNIPPQDMADLISFIKNWRYLDGAVPISPR